MANVKKVNVTGGLGNATEEDVLEGFTFSSDNGINKTGKANLSRINITNGKIIDAKALTEIPPNTFVDKESDLKMKSIITINYTFQASCKLNGKNNQFLQLIAFSRWDSSYKLRIATVTGSTITYGTNVSFASKVNTPSPSYREDLIEDFFLEHLEANKYVMWRRKQNYYVYYGDSPSYYNGFINYRIITVSDDNTITVGSDKALFSKAYRINKPHFKDNKLFVFYAKSYSGSNNTGATYLYCYDYVLNDDTIELSNEVVLYRGFADAYNPTCSNCLSDSKLIYYLHTGYGGNSYCTFITVNDDLTVSSISTDIAKIQSVKYIGNDLCLMTHVYDPDYHTDGDEIRKICVMNVTDGTLLRNQELRKNTRYLYHFIFDYDSEYYLLENENNTSTSNAVLNLYHLELGNLEYTDNITTTLLSTQTYTNTNNYYSDYLFVNNYNLNYDADSKCYLIDDQALLYLISNNQSSGKNTHILYSIPLFAISNASIKGLTIDNISPTQSGRIYVLNV